MLLQRAALGVLLTLVLGLAAVAPARAASLQSVTGWTGSATGLPSDVSMHIYVPDKVAPPILRC